MPHALLQEYIARRYNLTDNAAQEIIYNACRPCRRRPVAYITKNGDVALGKDWEMNSKILQQCRAFRVCCEFLPAGREFTFSSVPPWILVFYENGEIYYVCEFQRGTEYLQAEMIRTAGIPAEIQPQATRIGILAPGANRNIIHNCGIKYFCTVDDKFNLDVVESVPDEEVWNGVPIV